MKKTAIVLLTLTMLLPGLLTQSYCARPQQVIFDTDMGNDIDDALALAMLYEYQKQGKIDILGILSNKAQPVSVKFIDIMNHRYRFPGIPLGKISQGASFEPRINYTKVVSDDGSYSRSMTDYAKVPESVDLYRKLLAAQPDRSVAIISVGFLSNLARLLDSGADQYSPLTGRELVKRKISKLCLMGGQFTDIDKVPGEFNLKYDREAAQQVFAEWPTQIIVSPGEVGAKVLFPWDGMIRIFGQDPTHPLLVAYKAFRGGKPYDRPTWDLTSVLSAVEPVGDYFGISEPGHVVVANDARTYFVPCKDGRDYILSIDDIQANRIRERFLELVKP